MSDQSYTPLIDRMTWSYSRIKAFEDCPYRFYLKYIRRYPGRDMFFASYGSFMHHLLELYYKGEKTKRELITIYLRDFKTQVVGRAPNEKIYAHYFQDGLRYLKEFDPFSIKPVEIEKKVSLTLAGHPFIGYIDYLGADNNSLTIIDHKSRAMKPRSKRKKPTKSDLELDEYLRQLYLYAIAVEKEYGSPPEFLCFNCFRAQTIIKEPYDQDTRRKVAEWFADTIEDIRNETKFSPDMEYFKCTHLCEMHDWCEYFELAKW